MVIVWWLCWLCGGCMVVVKWTMLFRVLCNKWLFVFCDLPEIGHVIACWLKCHRVLSGIVLFKSDYVVPLHRHHHFQSKISHYFH